MHVGRGGLALTNGAATTQDFKRHGAPRGTPDWEPLG